MPLTSHRSIIGPIGASGMGRSLPAHRDAPYVPHKDSAIESRRPMNRQDPKLPPRENFASMLRVFGARGAFGRTLRTISNSLIHGNPPSARR